jgi:hypothetical protein
MPTPLKWNGPQFLAALNAELRRRISAACIVVSNHAKQLIGIEGAGSAIRKHSYWYGGRKRTVRKKGLVYGQSTSKPGEPPRKQTGRLQSSVAWELGDTIAGPAGRVGTNLGYGKALEMGATGTRSSAWGRPTRSYRWTLLARPWLRRALKECQGFIRAVMIRPWNP